MKLSNFQLPSSAEAFSFESMKMSFAITSANQIEMKVFEVSAKEKATGKSITSPPMKEDEVTPTTPTRKSR